MYRGESVLRVIVFYHIRKAEVCGVSSLVMPDQLPEEEDDYVQILQLCSSVGISKAVNGEAYRHSESNGEQQRHIWVRACEKIIREQQLSVVVLKKMLRAASTNRDALHLKSQALFFILRGTESSIEHTRQEMRRIAHEYVSQNPDDIARYKEEQNNLGEQSFQLNVFVQAIKNIIAENS